MKKPGCILILFISVFCWSGPAGAGSAGNYFKRAEQAARNGDNQTALQSYQEALSAGYNKGKVALALGGLYARSGDDTGAVKWLTTALGERLSSEDAIQADLNLGKIYYRNRDFAKALEYLKDALVIRPRQEDAHLNLALIYRDMRMYPEASQQMDFLARSRKLKFEYCLLKGQIYREWGIYRKADIYLGKAIISNPMSVDAHQNLAEVYFQQHDYGKALGEWKFVASLQPQAAVYQKMALCLYNLDETEKALASLLEAIKLEPNDYMNYALGGLIYSSGRDWEKALAQFNRALEINPTSDFCLFGQGLSNLHLQKRLPARDSFQKTVALNKSSWIGSLAARELNNMNGVK